MVIESGAEIRAEDMLNLTMLPVGTILMYDGDGWTDNQTLAGWYKCDGQNGTPDLRDSFLMSNTVSGTTGGANTSRNLPAHTHELILDNGLGSYTTSSFQVDYHYKNTSLHGGSSNIGTSSVHGRTDSGAQEQAAYNSLSNYHKKNCAQNTFNFQHTHVISGTAVLNNTGKNEGYDNRPNYYTVIYIKRMRKDALG